MVVGLLSWVLGWCWAHFKLVLCWCEAGVMLVFLCFEMVLKLVLVV